MNRCFCVCIMVCIISIFSSAMADTVTSPISFQVIDSQVNLTRTSIESATVEAGGLSLVLKPATAEQLKVLTQQNIGKYLNIIINGKLISSPIIQSAVGARFFIYPSLMKLRDCDYF